MRKRKAPKSRRGPLPPPTTLGEALRREAQMIERPKCEGCQSLAQLLSQAVSDNQQLLLQFDRLRAVLADMERMRNTNRIWA